jgi:tRNA (guanine-N7-)-methyltransferase
MLIFTKPLEAVTLIKKTSTLMENKVYLKEEDLGFQPKWSEIFNNLNPIYVEIGIGNGEFIVHLAKTYPHFNFVGTEFCREVLRKALKRAEREGLSNLRLLPMEGTKLLIKGFTSESISGLYLNFPDPWDKRKKRRNRLVNEAFVWLLADRLKEGGFFRMATDHRPYLEEVVKLFTTNEAFSPLWEELIRTEIEDFYPTKYARKWLSQGLPLYFTGFKKIKRVRLPDWIKEKYPLLRLTKEDYVPIISVLKVKDLQDFRALAKAISKGILYQSEGDLIKVLDVYTKEDGLLIDLIVLEKSLQQRFFVAVNPYETRGIIISVHSSDHPDPTDGVHLAISLITHKIWSFLPEAELIKTTCKNKIFNLSKTLV